MVLQDSESESIKKKWLLSFSRTHLQLVCVSGRLQVYNHHTPDGSKVTCLCKGCQFLLWGLRVSPARKIRRKMFSMMAPRHLCRASQRRCGRPTNLGKSVSVCRCWTTPYTNVIQLHNSAHCQIHIRGQLIFPRLYDRVYFISQLKKYFFF